jgi:hypothetical protein
MGREKNISAALLVVMMLIPLALLVMPANYFDNGPAMCPSKRFFDIECPGCGMTRAVMHLIHFDLESAVYYNSLSLIVAPVLGVWWCRQIWKNFQALRHNASDEF